MELKGQGTRPEKDLIYVITESEIWKGSPLLMILDLLISLSCVELQLILNLADKAYTKGLTNSAGVIISNVRNYERLIGPLILS
jgi:hypothetical protein